MEAKTHELKLWVLLIFRQQGESRKCHIPVKREEQMDGGLQILMVTLKQRELFCSSSPWRPPSHLICWLWGLSLLPLLFSASLTRLAWTARQPSQAAWVGQSGSLLSRMSSSFGDCSIGNSWVSSSPWGTLAFYGQVLYLKGVFVLPCLKCFMVLKFQVCVWLLVFCILSSD